MHKDHIALGVCPMHKDHIAMGVCPMLRNLKPLTLSKLVCIKILNKSERVKTCKARELVACNYSGKS